MKTSLPIYQADAFTKEMFKGNPAAVVPLSAWLPAPLMQQIAMENNLAETAFYVPNPNDAHSYHLRWFTPAIEVDLCGHATLAAAFIINHLAGGQIKQLTFTTQVAGPLTVNMDNGWYYLDFPAWPPQAIAKPDGLAKALRLMPQQILQVLRTRDLLVVVDNAQTVANLQPDFNALAELDTLGVIVTAAGPQGIDAVSRFFAPKAGINEDPVTGSAHCTLIPYWREQLNKDNLVMQQWSARGGHLVCKLVGDRVHIGGQVVLYMQGEIFV